MRFADQRLLEDFLVRAREPGRIVPSSTVLHERLSDRRPRRVVTINLFELHHYVRDPAHRALVDGADFWTADGWPVVQALDRVGVDSERVTGSGLCADLLVLAPSAGLRRLAVLGSESHIVEEYERQLSTQQRTIVLRDTGDRKTWTKESLREDVQRSEPDLLLVAVGTPYGVAVAADLQDVLPCPVIAVGAGVGLAVGLERRAPAALQRLNVEWAWRLLTDPRRLAHRYLVECAPLMPALRAAAKAVSGG